MGFVSCFILFVYRLNGLLVADELREKIQNEAFDTFLASTVDTGHNWDPLVYDAYARHPGCHDDVISESGKGTSKKGKGKRCVCGIFKQMLFIFSGKTKAAMNETSVDTTMDNLDVSAESGDLLGIGGQQNDGINVNDGMCEIGEFVFVY